MKVIKVINGCFCIFFCIMLFLFVDMIYGGIIFDDYKFKKNEIVTMKFDGRKAQILRQLLKPVIHNVYYEVRIAYDNGNIIEIREEWEIESIKSNVEK